MTTWTRLCLKEMKDKEKDSKSSKTSKEKASKDKEKDDAVGEESDEVSVEDIAAFKKKLDFRIRHIRNVQKSAELLAERLADRGEFDLARRLVQNSLHHDSSKFEGIEWEFLDFESSDKENKEKLQLAVYQHQQGNDHHPEFFAHGIDDMSQVQIAEMVCDWKARSEEFGSSLRDWIKEKASERYGFSLRSKNYQKIKFFVDLLLDPTIG